MRSWLLKSRNASSPLHKCSVLYSGQIWNRYRMACLADSYLYCKLIKFVASTGLPFGTLYLYRKLNKFVTSTGWPALQTPNLCKLFRGMVWPAYLLKFETGTGWPRGLTDSYLGYIVDRQGMACLADSYVNCTPSKFVTVQDGLLGRLLYWVNW